MTLITGLKCLTNPRQRWLNLWEVEYVDEKGRTRTWQFASRNDPPNPAELPKVNAVVVFARVLTPTGQKLVVTRESRVVVGGKEWGVVAGLMSSTETPEDAARRELKEETGLDLVSVEKVSCPIVSSAGAMDEAVIMVFCTAEGELSQAHLEDGECIEAFLLDETELAKLVDRLPPYHEGAMSGKAWPVFFSLVSASKPLNTGFRQ